VSPQEQTMYNIPAKIGVILVFVSLFFWGCGTYLAVKGVEVHDGRIPATATVIDFEEASLGGQVRYRPVLLFESQGGEAVQATLKNAFETKKYAVGQELEVRYGRIDREDVIIDTGDKGWVVLVVVFGFAASFTIAGVLLITVITRAMNRRREARGHAAGYY
jgi:hypothetical protein